MFAESYLTLTPSKLLKLVVTYPCVVSGVVLVQVGVNVVLPVLAMSLGDFKAPSDVTGNMFSKPILLYGLNSANLYNPFITFSLGPLTILPCSMSSHIVLLLLL